MLRHPDNTNLTIHYADTFQGLPVMADKGPFFSNYLARLKLTIERSLAQYSRVLAFRIDLRLPATTQLPDYAYTNEVISLFLESFKAKIKHNREIARRTNQYAHDSNVRYVWAREQGQGGRPHYHLVILLNQDAFYTVGKLDSDRVNMFHRLQEAWASALRLQVHEVSGLVEVPMNATYRLRRDAETYQELFKRASYLCKTATKAFGDGCHGFDTSRV